MNTTQTSQVAPPMQGMHLPHASSATDDPQAKSDEQLVIAAQGGDTRALEVVLGRHRRMLYYSARRIVATAEEAEDVVQESMLRAVMNIGNFRRESRFATWLVAIALNAALTIRRKEKGIQWIPLDEDSAENIRGGHLNLCDPRMSPEDHYSSHEMRNLLRLKIGKLHHTYRHILQACILSEYSTEQAAKALGITECAAKSRLSRAKRGLLNSWRKSGPAGQFAGNPKALITCDQGEY